MQVSEDSNTLSTRKEHQFFEVILPSQSLSNFLHDTSLGHREYVLRDIEAGFC